MTERERLEELAEELAEELPAPLGPGPGFAAAAAMRRPSSSRDVDVAQGARTMLAELRSPAYLKLCGKCFAIGIGVGNIARRRPDLAAAAGLIGGMYIGLSMAAYIGDKREHRRALGVVDVVAVEAPVRPEIVDGSDAA